MDQQRLELGPLGMKQIAAQDHEKIWALDKEGTLYSRNLRADAGWQKLRGTVNQIFVGADGEVWATNPADSKRVLRWDGASWTANIPPG